MVACKDFNNISCELIQILLEYKPDLNFTVYSYNHTYISALDLLKKHPRTPNNIKAKQVLKEYCSK